MSKLDFNWDIFPSTRLEANNLVTPVGCMYTPFDTAIEEVSESFPLRCDTCQVCINQLIRLDRLNMNWWCPFCCEKNSFPENFHIPEKGSVDQDYPVSIRPSTHGTVDYILPHMISESNFRAKFVVYVIDTYEYVDRDKPDTSVGEFHALKAAIAESVKRLPKETKVILLTFTDKVILHKPSEPCKEIFLPEKPVYEANQFTYEDIKGLYQKHQPVVLELSESSISFNADESLSEYILGLESYHNFDLKPLRATGLALFLTCQIVTEILPSSCLGKALLFSTGPATQQPGKVVNELETIRTHADILRGNTPLLVHASRFYKTLALISAGFSFQAAIKMVYKGEKQTLLSRQSDATTFVFDIFCGSVNQSGLYEMKHLVEAGNGHIFMTESFTSERLKKSLEASVVAFLDHKLNCVLTVFPSFGLKVLTAIANCTALQSSYQQEKFLHLHEDNISDVVTKYDSSFKEKNFTNQWFMGNLNPKDTAAIFFDADTVSSSSKLDIEKGAKEHVVQFQVRFFDPIRNNNVLRVTTIRRPTTLAVLALNTTGTSGTKLIQNQVLKEKQISESFNADAWIVMLTRLLINKIDTPGGYEPIEDILEKTNKSMVKLLHNFGGISLSYKSGANPYQSLRLNFSINENFKKLPTYAYNLCRNPQLTRVFNSSPDETILYHHMFKTLALEDSEIMLKPVLYQFDNGILEQVPNCWASLDVSGKDSKYFVMDCFSQVFIYKSLASENDRLLLHPSDNEFLLSEPKHIPELVPIVNLTVENIIRNRQLVPDIIISQTGHSQARFLRARLYSPVTEVHEITTKHKGWWPFGKKKKVPSKKLTDEMPPEEFYEMLLKKVRAFKVNSLY